jgi:hypothetical protein
MKVGTRNVSSLYRSESLKAAATELAKYKLDLMGDRRSDETRVALNQQMIMHSSMEIRILIIT